ncbi:MAG: hypothetical protein AAF847_18360, partial [Bacteroidota bacterium]
DRFVHYFFYDMKDASIWDKKVHFYFEHFVELLKCKNVELIVPSLPLAKPANGTVHHYQFDN